MWREYFDDFADEDSPELIADCYLQDDRYDSEIDPFLWDDYDCEEDREWDEYVGVRLDDKLDDFDYQRYCAEFASEPFDYADELDIPDDSNGSDEFDALHEQVDLEEQAEPFEHDALDELVVFDTSYTSDNSQSYSDPVPPIKQSPTLWETIYKIAFDK